MNATPHILVFCLIWQYCYVHGSPEECDKASALNGHVKPINLSVEVKERFLDLSWDCVYSSKTKHKMEYGIYLKNDEVYEYLKGIKRCNVKIPLENRSAVCLKVIPAINREECHHLSSEKCVNLERNGTLAENVSCKFYNTSLACTWRSGKNAPLNTSYILSIRQRDESMQCQQYERNLQTSIGACTFHDLSLNIFEAVTIVLKGKDPGIEVFEETIQLAKIEIFNPPRDISVTSFGDRVTIHWQSPQIQYDAEECFQYNIQKNKDLYIPSSNPYTILNLEKEFSIRIRARGIKTCDMNTQWGEWSEWISSSSSPVVGTNPHGNQMPLELISVILVSALILVILIFTTLNYKRIVNTCFPRIPQPKNYLGSTEDCIINTKNIDSLSPMLHKYETEEYVIIRENVS